MADLYAAAFIGVKDGTKVPADRANGQIVNSKRRSTLAAKAAAQAIASGDRLFLGTLRAGERLAEIIGNTDTSLATTTISIGTTASPTKYVNAATLTATNINVILGPRTAPLIAGAVTADEDLWATFGVAGVAGGVNFAFQLDICSAP